MVRQVTNQQSYLQKKKKNQALSKNSNQFIKRAILQKIIKTSGQKKKQNKKSPKNLTKKTVTFDNQEDNNSSSEENSQDSEFPSPKKILNKKIQKNQEKTPTKDPKKRYQQQQKKNQKNMTKIEKFNKTIQKPKNALKVTTPEKLQEESPQKKLPKPQNKTKQQKQQKQQNRNSEKSTIQQNQITETKTRSGNMKNNSSPNFQNQIIQENKTLIKKKKKIINIKNNSQDEQKINQSPNKNLRIQKQIVQKNQNQIDSSDEEEENENSEQIQNNQSFEEEEDQEEEEEEQKNNQNNFFNNNQISNIANQIISNQNKDIENQILQEIAHNQDEEYEFQEIGSKINNKTKKQNTIFSNNNNNNKQNQLFSINNNKNNFVSKNSLAFQQLQEKYKDIINKYENNSNPFIQNNQNKFLNEQKQEQQKIINKTKRLRKTSGQNLETESIKIFSEQKQNNNNSMDLEDQDHITIKSDGKQNLTFIEDEIDQDQESTKNIYSNNNNNYQKDLINFNIENKEDFKKQNGEVNLFKIDFNKNLISQDSIFQNNNNNNKFKTPNKKMKDDQIQIKKNNKIHLDFKNYKEFQLQENKEVFEQKNEIIEQKKNSKILQGIQGRNRYVLDSPLLESQENLSPKQSKILNNWENQYEIQNQQFQNPITKKQTIGNNPKLIGINSLIPFNLKIQQKNEQKQKQNQLFQFQLQNQELQKQIDAQSEHYLKISRLQKQQQQFSFNNKGYQQQNFQKIDMILCVDATQTMTQYVQKCKDIIIHTFKKCIQNQIILRVGIVFYRDHPPEDQSFITKHLDLTNNINKLIQFIEDIKGGQGGGDIPDAVMDGLWDSLKLSSWRKNSQKYIIHICDSPPHGDIFTGTNNYFNRSFMWRQGCPCGITIEKIGNIINQYQIKYRLVKIGQDLQRMSKIFKSNISTFKEIQVQSEKDLEKFITGMLISENIFIEDIE